MIVWRTVSSDPGSAWTVLQERGGKWDTLRGREASLSVSSRKDNGRTLGARQDHIAPAAQEVRRQFNETLCQHLNFKNLWRGLGWVQSSALQTKQNKQAPNSTPQYTHLLSKRTSLQEVRHTCTYCMFRYKFPTWSLCTTKIFQQTKKNLTSSISMH